ncbi:MAG: hemerythrin domain-containing protein, partial [Ktedonobacterales bacterium]
MTDEARDADPIATLRIQHDAARAFLASHGAADLAAADLLAYLENVVQPHMRAEETLCFPPLRAAALPWN